MGVYTTKIDPGIKPEEIEAACSRINTQSFYSGKFPLSLRSRGLGLLLLFLIAIKMHSSHMILDGVTRFLKETTKRPWIFLTCLTLSKLLELS